MSDTITTRELSLSVGEVTLTGQLSTPDGARGVVLFAHGSGSGRLSPRNRFVAAGLNRLGLGTLLFDLLSTEEEDDGRGVFDIELLAGRLLTVTGALRRSLADSVDWIGYFGASTGAAAALWAAAEPDNGVTAVVSRGGRPDLAGSRLAAVTAPTLLIVGGRDTEVLRLNRAARTRLGGPNRLEVVPGATHLFGEPGALTRVTELAGDWFLRWGGRSGEAPGGTSGVRPDTEAEPGQARADGAEPGQAGPDGAAPGEVGPDRAEPGQARPDGAEPGQARPDGAEPGQARPDGAESGQAGPDGAAPGEVGPDGPGAVPG